MWSTFSAASQVCLWLVGSNRNHKCNQLGVEFFLVKKGFKKRLPETTKLSCKSMVNYIVNLYSEHKTHHQVMNLRMTDIRKMWTSILPWNSCAVAVMWSLRSTEECEAWSSGINDSSNATRRTHSSAFVMPPKRSGCRGRTMSPQKLEVSFPCENTEVQAKLDTKKLSW